MCRWVVEDLRRCYRDQQIDVLLNWGSVQGGMMHLRDSQLFDTYIRENMMIFASVVIDITLA